MGISSSEIWFVGDKLEFDVLGARNAAIFSVWYNKRHESTEDIAPDAAVHDWKEFIELVKGERLGDGR